MDDELDELFNQIEITGDTVAAEYAVSETEREQITLVVDEGTVVPVVEDEERESTIVFAEPYEDHAYMFSSPPIEVRASMSSPTNATSSSNENYPTPPPPSQPIVPVLPITLPPPPPTAPQQIDIGGVLSEKHRLLQASEFQYLSKKHSSNPNAKNIPGNLSKLAFQLTLSQEESIRYHETRKFIYCLLKHCILSVCAYFIIAIEQSKELEEGKALAKNIVEVYKDQHTALTKQLLQTEKDNHGKHKPTKGSTRLSTSSGNGHGGVVSEHNDIAMQLTKNASSKLAFREVIRKHLQRYIELKNELMVKAVSVMEYPWHMVDNSVNSACAPYLKKAAELQRVEETQEVRPTDQSGHSSSSHQIGACRAYVIGFFEVLCCIPASMCSKQGVMFYQHAGVAIGRHPFRYSFMVVLVCLQILLSEVYMENLTHDIMLQTINDFVALAAQVWELK